MPDTPTEDDIEAFGLMCQAMEAEHGMPDLHTLRHTAEGIEGRSVVIKAGTFLVGLPHKLSGLAVCVGDITVWTAGQRQRLTGAHVLQTRPGGMRVGFAHADTTWLTVHANTTGSADQRVVEDSLVEHADRLMTRRGVLQ